jgi:cytochrome c553
MPIRAIAVLATVLAALLTPLPATAQTDRTLSASADLDARLAEAQRDPKLADSLFRTGRKVAAVCANCHGEGGISSKPEVPNLAGQNTAYLLEQLRRFAEGRRRFEFMEGMIKAMNADEKVGMAMFYAAQPVPTRPAADAALRTRGRTIFQQVCFRCHADDGHGNEKFARIAGQPFVYLKATLKRYRSNTGERIDPLMAANTKLLTDADIEAVVAFVAGMP